jgi:catechol 2,3-dioxygenase-like lactoylglutathione lyase family enzyme
MKLHVSMRVEDLDQAIQFYSALFNQEPLIQRDKYAKWDVQDPSVNFVIESGHAEGGLDHLGIQVASQEELDPLVDRMRATGNAFLDTECTTCCYAKMEKAWVKGVADEKWEAFLTHSHDENEYGEDRENQLDAM